MSPDKNGYKTYSEFVKNLCDHFVPKPTETVQHFNGMLRDHLVWGMADERIQHRLLLESTLTLEKAYNIAMAQEMALHDAQISIRLQLPPVLML